MNLRSRSLDVSLENDNTYLVSVANPEREDLSIIFFEEDRTLIMSELTSNEAVVL